MEHRKYINVYISNTWNKKETVLSKDITNGMKETLGLRDTELKEIAFLSCEDNMLAIMANTKRLFTQVVSSISLFLSNNPLEFFLICLI